MIIDDTNYQIGNKAMANVLLLYYHLLREGSINYAQTVYLDHDDFDGFKFLDVEVQESYSPEIDETLIREGAVTYLLCELNDVITEYYEDNTMQPLTEKIYKALKAQKNELIPEVDLLLKYVMVAETEFDFTEYNKILQGIYKKYGHGFFVSKLKARP